MLNGPCKKALARSWGGWRALTGANDGRSQKTLVSSHETLRVFTGAHERSRVLAGANDGRSQKTLQSAHNIWQVPANNTLGGLPALADARGCSRALTGAHGRSRVLTGANDGRSQKTLQSAHNILQVPANDTLGGSRALAGARGCSRALTGAHGCSQALTTGAHKKRYRALTTFCGCSQMTFSAARELSWVLAGARGRSRALTGAVSRALTGAVGRLRRALSTITYHNRC